MRTPLSHVRDLLRNHHAFHGLLEQRQQERDLLSIVRAQLPESMREHCLDVGISGSRLTLYVDSPAWATRARFLTTELLAAVQRSQPLDEVRIQMRVGGSDAPVTERPAVPQRMLSAATVAHLLDTAEHMKDPDLQRTFRRMAQRHLQAPDD